jgi:hypothetical protein
MAHQVLDFGITGTSFEVFDARTGDVIAREMRPSRDAAIVAAVGTIARHTPTMLFVLRMRSGYSVWHPEARAWLPMVLTPEANDGDAFDMAAGFAWANGRAVEVLDVARF